MSRSLRQLTEAQIRAAEAKGALRGLAGEGKPLPHRTPDETSENGAGLRIMAEAGVVPEEFTLRKKIDALRAEWQAATDPDEKKRLMARFADLSLRYEIAREARQKFLR